MKDLESTEQRILKKLKSESSEKYHVYADGNYRIRFLEHGSDSLVYIEDNNALIVEMEWSYPKNYLLSLLLIIFRLVKIKLYSRGMKTWDDGMELTPEDRERVTSRISDFIFDLYKKRPIVV